ncbi:hypothetical protein P8C59_005645 [Phyllachora maydis]|uniref:COP9 signalosome complex subunit 4 n=1 Tax=Phyllachora maydis TaxID=1825666 RepID=A0AAD9MBN2_9PEZI|nr:hypothetical protein P8C59_005645 [Phyllachora maydis]
MAPTTVSQALAEAGTLADPTDAYRAILANIKTLSTPASVGEDLKALLDAVFAAPLGLVATRAVVTDFLAALRALGNHGLWIEAGMHLVRALAAAPSLQSALAEAAAAARELVATAHEANEDFGLAARTLADMPLDSSARRLSDAERAAVWIRIVRNHLETGADGAAAAEAYLNKLKNIMPDVADAELQLHFKLSAARIQDANRQFIAAAVRYHHISGIASLAEEERLHTLAMAIKCAVLAPAGPPRSRILGRLYKDARSAGLAEFGMLEKMFLDRLLAPAEVDKFAQGLAPHQLALTADGSTVLAKAVVEHNLLSASRLYANIGFDHLGLLLGLDGDKAEETTAKMVEQGRLNGRIDQIERVVWFDGSAEGPADRGTGRCEPAALQAMRRWDANVQALAEQVEQLTNALQAEFPDFVAAQVAAV